MNATNNAVSVVAKKHHYVPQFLLRHFAHNSRKNPKIWTLDKLTGKTFATSTENIGHENRFYTVTNDRGELVDYEGFTQRIDSIGGEIINDVVSHSTLAISDENRVWLSYFIAFQMMRVPSIRKEIAHVRSMIIKKWGAHVRYEGDSRTIGEVTEKDDRLTAFMLLRHDIPEFARLIQEKVWWLCESPQGTSFYLSDCPVVKHNLIDRWPRGNLGLKNDGIELYLPLSPRLALHIVCPQLAAVACAQPFWGEQYRLCGDTGVPMMMKAENVVFMNSLQVASSERYVFAQSDSDFELAVDMLRTNPELKTGPGNRPDDGAND